MKDIIILGMGNTRVYCPYDCEVWGVNNGYRQVMSYNRSRDKAKEEIDRLEKILLTSTDQSEIFSVKCDIDENKELLVSPMGRLDKLFICHRGQEYDQMGDAVFDFNEINTLAKQGVEIMSLFKVKEIDELTRIPFRTLVKKFGTEFFTDTIAYMVAYAIHINSRKVNGLLRLKEPMRIRLYGVDMHTQDEYATEKGGIEYFIAVARTLGAEFWIHPDSSICKTVTFQPYGFYKLDKKTIDPYNAMELQKSVKGIKKLKKLGLITNEMMEDMIKRIESAT